jgi:outer membrane protein
MRWSGWRVRAAACALAAAMPTMKVSTGLEAQEPVGQQEIALEQAIRLALLGNRELEAARLQLVAADGQVREAWAAVYPTIDASATYTRNINVPGQFLPAAIFDPSADPDELTLVRFGSDNTWFGQLRLEQTVFQASVFLGLGAASRFQALQEEVVRGREQEIVTRTKQRYFDVLLAEEAVRLNEESVRRVQQALTETQAMQRAGLVGDYDALRLEVELANLESNLRRAGNDAEAARRTLAVELGMDDGVELNVAGSLRSVEIDTADAAADPFLTSFGVTVDAATTVDQLIAQANRSRSDMRQVQLTEELRRTELRMEQSEYLPRVSFFATYGINAQADGGINPFGWSRGNSVTSPQAGIQVTVPIFDGFRRPARINQMRSTVRQTETQGSLLSAQTDNQVRTLFDQVEEARLRASDQQTAVARATRGYEIASAQFREGLGTRLELTDAEVALRQTEFNLAQSVHDYLTARAMLDQAVGVVPEAR